MIEIKAMNEMTADDLDMIETKCINEMTAEEKEDGKACLREGGISLAPGLDEKLRKAGLSIEEVEALLMRALGGEN